MNYLFFSLGILIASMGVSRAGEIAAYTGKLDCAHLDFELAQRSRLKIGRYCKGASEACEIQKMWNQLDKNHPLAAVMKGRIQNYLNLELEICELAFAVNDPEYYEKYFSRTEKAQHKFTEKNEDIAPTTIE